MRALAPLLLAFAAWLRPRSWRRRSALRPSAYLLAALAVLCAAASAFAEKRVALVIGNGAYRHAPALANPRNDAQAMAAALVRMKFEVVSGLDLDKAAMERLLRDFVQKLDNADLALVFYAGHGLQVHGRNYFVPVDAKLERETDLAFEAVSLELVQGVLEQTRRTNILILDACRDNPLARNLARSMGTRSTGIGRGLGQAQAGIGTLIVYATQPGNVALDGDGTANSPFTTALLKHIETPGLEIRLIVSRVRQAVIEATRDRQVPWDSSSLVGEVYLSKAPAPETRPPPAPGASTTDEVSFWQGIRDSRSAGDFKAYLERWPNGLFASLARARIAEIERASAEDVKRAEEQRKKAADDQRADAERKAREEGRQEAERKRIQSDTMARLGAQRLDQAKAALRQNKYPEARRLADESAALVKEATELSSASATAQGAARDLAAFRSELDRRIEQRAAVLVREARGFIAAKKFAEAEKRLVEAERIASASTVAARRELEAAQGRAEADAKKKAEDEAKKKAEEEKKKADEARPAAPDPKKQAQTAVSWYAPERKRGLIAFAHKQAILAPGAVAALERLATTLKDKMDYKISIVAAADRSEGTAAELQALSRARIAAIQQWLAANGVAAASLRTGIATARGEGPEYRTVAVTVEPADRIEGKRAAPIPPGASSPSIGAPDQELTRRLSGSAWQGAVSPTTLGGTSDTGNGSATIQFAAGGHIGLVGQVHKMNARGPGLDQYTSVNDDGRWSVAEGKLCAAFRKLDGGARHCYTATLNDDGSVTLSGRGLLAGKRFSK